MLLPGARERRGTEFISRDIPSSGLAGLLPCRRFGTFLMHPGGILHRDLPQFTIWIDFYFIEKPCYSPNSKASLINIISQTISRLVYLRNCNIFNSKPIIQNCVLSRHILSFHTLVESSTRDFSLHI